MLALSLQACVSAPPSDTVTAAASTPDAATTPAGQVPADAPGEVPELNLKLTPAGKCDCGPTPASGDIIFDKGYRALLDGEYEDAMQHFQRYQRLENSPRADLEAGIAIAYLRMLPRSPFYDPGTARTDFRGMRDQNAKALKVNESTRLMRQALLNLLQLQGETDKLKSTNATLKEDLQKREEALKRLRDLTLNQKAAAP